jgi:RNA polymerase sigma-70 factor (ECF subfamily)
LVARAQEGDTAAYAVLVRRYQQAMYRLALRLLDDRQEAEDATQESFLSAWRRLGGYRGEAAFSSWMYRIVTNRCLNTLRSRRSTASLDAANEDVPGPEARGPERGVEANEQLGALSGALAGLPPDQRACWLLREGEGLSYAEIAAIVGGSPGAVRGRIHRARRRLAEVMQPWR